MWLFSRNIDLFGLYIPVWLTWCLAFLLPLHFLEQSLPIWMWLAFVLLFDVAHVWSTIFKTYLDAEARKQHGFHLIFVPIIVFVACLIILSFGDLIFWRCMAYLALYHFIKQQYGFLMLYKWKAKDGSFPKWDKFIIYWATIYPIVYWHIGSSRNFNWFVEGDFLIHTGLVSEFALNMGNLLYCLVIAFWFYLQRKSMNLPKMLWVLTTAVNWYIGIVYFNSDIVFTMTNVVAHGLPYMILIAFYRSRKHVLKRIEGSKVESRKRKGEREKWLMTLVLVVFVSFIFAFTEEYFWDSLVNHSKAVVFAWLPYRSWDLNGESISLFIAILSVPQLTHYILDGIIWKNNEKNPYLKKMFQSNLKSGIDYEKERIS